MAVKLLRVKIAKLNFVIFVRNVNVIAIIKKYAYKDSKYKYIVTLGWIRYYAAESLEEALDKRDEINGWDVLIDARRRTKSNYNKPGCRPYRRRK